MSVNLRGLLGSQPSSEHLLDQIAFLSSLVSNPNAAIPEIKSYPDAVYFNYFHLGFSLLFSPVDGYKPRTGLNRADLRDNNLVLDSIDIYNRLTATTERTFSSYPLSPFNITLPSSRMDTVEKTRPVMFDVLPEMTGKEFVGCLGEPDRKGGGEGPSSGSIGIWCEWSKDGVMVEFGGDESRGPQAWERGKDAVWKVITMFPPRI
jgi:hypothetical protein